MSVYGYIRSPITKEVTPEEAQERSLIDYATHHGMEVERLYVDRGVSGRVLIKNRPQGGRLLEALKAGDTLITPTLGDLFHTAKAAMDGLGKLWHQSVSVHILDLGGDVRNGTQQKFKTLLQAFADIERSRDRERSLLIKASERKKGKYLGGAIPFGYRVSDEGELTEAPEQMEAIQTIKDMRAQGLSLRGIAEALQAQGINISHEAVRDVLRREDDVDDE